MQKVFEVAGFPFVVEMPAEHPLWDNMSNYAPFERRAGAAGGDGKIFTLRVVESLPARDREPLWVEEPEPGMPVISLYRAGESLRCDMSPLASRPLCCELEIAPDFASGQLCIQSSTLSDAIFSLNNSLMLLFAFATARRGALEMHSSVVTNAGRGYLFLGRSGTGKSTHSRLWMENIPGTTLLNDDNPILRLQPDGTVRVFGSPWSGKTPCYKSADAPVGAIVRIRQAPHNAIERLPLVQAYASIYSSCSSFRPLQDLADGWHETISGIVSTVPCYVLDCLPDAGAAHLCHDTVTHPEA